MCRIYTLLFAGCIGFAGLSAHAQPLDFGSMMQSLTSGGTSQGISTSDFVGGVISQIVDSPEEARPQISIIDAPLIVEAVIPNVNQTVAGIIIGDAQTGRYPPRLKIDFSEFPLRSLNTINERNVEPKTQAEIVVQRIQTRLRVPQIALVVKDRTAVISGTVASERLRNLAESMLRFEPGIDIVQNKITVVP